MSSGPQFRELRLALGIGLKALARELGVVYQSVQEIEKNSTTMKVATEARMMAALTVLAKRAAAERDRAKTAELLAIADLTLLDLSSAITV